MMLDAYRQRFARLHTDKNRNRWSDETTFRAPHKPLLLLSLLDLFAEGAVTTNLIEPSADLLELCRLCHWSFDDGLMSISDDYRLLTASELSTHPNIPGHLATLTGRPIILPTDQPFWPDRESLEWHRREVFRSR